MMSTYCQTEEALWCCDNEGLTIVPLHLATEEMEILHRSGWEDDMHVDIRVRLRGIRVVRELVLNDQDG